MKQLMSRFLRKGKRGLNIPLISTFVVMFILAMSVTVNADGETDWVDVDQTVIQNNGGS